ncbi:lipopolysaccharide core heptose(II) kinase RfaY, partial [Escherichia coli]
MITSIRYRGFSFYYKDNDNKYKEIFGNDSNLLIVFYVQ